MSSTTRSALRWLVAAGLVAWPAGIPIAAASDAEPIRAEFQAVCERLTGGDDHFFGRAVIRDLEAQLQEARQVPQQRVLLQVRLGNELLRLGELERAITRLAEAIELMERAALDAAHPVYQTALRTLAIAHLLLAEDQNCVDLHASGSCILPIRPQAVHRLKEHSRQAGDLFARLAAQQPEDLTLRWLLNLARMLSGDYPGGVPARLRLPGDALRSRVKFPPWAEIGAGLGLAAPDLAGGAVMDDFDGDGLLDLVSTSWHPCEPMKAWRNDGRGGFEDVARRWGLDSQLGGLNLVQADYDGDGMLDLLVLRGAWLGRAGRIRNSLLRNELRGASGRFRDVTAAAGLATPAYPTQAAAWADHDLDGDLDLFVGNEAGVSAAMSYGATEEPYPSQLFRNGGDGTFSDVAPAAGVENLRFAKGVAWGDFDDDGDPDLYVSNFGPNRLFRNQGDGRFVDVAEPMAVAEPSRGSFATWFFDYDNDGDLDLLVADYGSPFGEVIATLFGREVDTGHPVLYRNDGDRFRDVSTAVGLTRPHLPMGANYGDLDNDGWLDFYLGTGVPNYEALMPNAMYRNRDGRRFDDVSFAGGFAHLQKGHGVAFGDLDNDGDQDLFHQLGGAFPYDAYGNALFENPGSRNHWLVLRLRGREANRFAVGARIEVRVVDDGGRRSIHGLVGSGGSFGGSSLQHEIGLGRATSVEAVIIDWPGRGGKQSFGRVATDRFYLVEEGEPELVEITVESLRLGRGRPSPARHQHPRG